MRQLELQESSWADAWERGQVALEGVTRRRIEGASKGVELAVLDWGGTGELVVIHHANGFCAATLAPIANALRGRFRVFSVDARGHGDSTPVAPVPQGGSPDPYDWGTLAADIDHVIGGILAITGGERVALAIGHSFGGALLLRAARANPARFERLLLCDPVVLPKLTAEQRAARSNTNGLAAMTRNRRDRFPTREAAFEHCRSRSLFSSFTPEALALYVAEGMAETSDGDIALKCDRDVEASIFEAGGLGSEFEGASRVTAEVVFLHAQRGNFPLETFRSIAAQMPRSRVESLDVGHLFPMEEPERVLQFVEKCLADL